MRLGGKLHLGHYHGVLKYWIQLQYEHNCLFMVADIHGLTSQYEDTRSFEQNIFDMVVSWLAVGIDPSQAVIFIQSQVPEHLELQGILSMITPLSWLERVMSYKEQVEREQNKVIDTYGALGYPLLQSADVLLYNSRYVPLRQEELSHIEFTREIARRFNHLYGRENGYEDLAMLSIKKLSEHKANLYITLLTRYQQNGDDDALDEARSLIGDSINISNLDKERLLGFLENKGKIILQEPQVLALDTELIVGLDGAKMSRSYANTIDLLEDKESILLKIKEMQTDPSRVRLTDKGNPEECPVWKLHQVYSTDANKKWVENGCTNASIGCLDCKGVLSETICVEQAAFRAKAMEYTKDVNLVRKILAEGRDNARAIASERLKLVKKAMKIYY